MTTFPNAPRFLKGAIVTFDLANPLASVIVFQYNPNTLRRSLQPQVAGGRGERSEALRLEGAPEETISLEVEIDATDQLERTDRDALRMGVHPQLSALEMLLYPKSAQVIFNTILMATGTIEIIPPEAPFTLLIWGPRRILPVRLTGFEVTEEEHDVNLNPIRATVSLNLRVLSYSDLPLTHPGYHLFLAHQVVKETMATIGSTSNVAAVAGSNVDLF
jgi:hypothetical protein